MRNCSLLLRVRQRAQAMSPHVVWDKGLSANCHIQAGDFLKLECVERELASGYVILKFPRQISNRTFIVNSAWKAVLSILNLWSLCLSENREFVVYLIVWLKHFGIFHRKSIELHDGAQQEACFLLAAKSFSALFLILSQTYQVQVRSLKQCLVTTCSKKRNGFNPPSRATRSSILESQHEHFPFLFLDLSCCCYDLSYGWAKPGSG
jgi:hypothetical protein